MKVMDVVRERCAPGPRYDLVVTAPGVPLVEAEVRALIARHPTMLEELKQTGPHRAAVRLVTSYIYDVVVSLEAVGLEVVRVVSSSRRRDALTADFTLA